MGRLFVQVGDQLLGGRGHGRSTFEDNVLGREAFAVYLFVGPIVGSHGRARERDAGKESARPRVGQDFGPHGDVRRSLRRASLGAGGGRGIGSELHLLFRMA